MTIDKIPPHSEPTSLFSIDGEYNRKKSQSLEVLQSVSNENMVMTKKENRSNHL